MEKGEVIAMKTIAAFIAALLALAGIFCLGRYTVGKTPYDAAMATVAGRYHRARNAVIGWFRGLGGPQSDAAV
jgi:hypothetical protein